jgi:poly(hydroxyalkanoate) depolymerase family esterase
MTSLLDKLLGEATRLTRSGRLQDATAAIQHALGGLRTHHEPQGRPADAAALDERPVLPRALHRGLPGSVPRPGAVPPTSRAPISERTARRRTTEPAVAERAVAEPVIDQPVIDQPAIDEPVIDEPGQPKRRPRDAPGTFETHLYSGRSGTRQYKLFVPAGHAGETLGLILMLHGCTQTPDDFAAGTRMNEVAAERGFLVLYPAQAPRSNQSKCWNWFQPGDQRRGGGEPDLLASLTRHIVQTHPVDPARVYVAGLSAGGAMADILGREYPDLFAAVGVHSGLPQGAAHDVASAFTAMRQGPGAGAGGPDRVALFGTHGTAMSATPGAWMSALPGAAPASGTPVTRAANTGAAHRADASGTPTIVFHGDADATVHPSNGARVIGAALAGAPAAEVTTERRSAGDRSVTRNVHRRPGDGDGPSLAEHWVVHGAGHAWSGGDPAGSYADARGPDASREMVRFFEEHPRRPT